MREDGRNAFGELIARMRNQGPYEVRAEILNFDVSKSKWVGFSSYLIPKNDSVFLSYWRMETDESNIKETTIDKTNYTILIKTAHNQLCGGLYYNSYKRNKRQYIFYSSRNSFI